MGRINAARMVLGGLVAGVVINLGEFLLNGPVAGERFEAAMAEFGVAAPEGGAIALFVLFGFLMGIVGVWLYAAMRPRYGEGPATAIRAGLAAWFFAYAIPVAGYAVMGMIDGGLMTLVLVWGLIEIPLALVAGAYFYQEEGEPATAAEPAAAARAAAPAGGAPDAGPTDTPRTGGGGFGG